MNLFIEFPPVSTAEWEAAVQADLKGRDPKSLGKILYRADAAPTPTETQPWPARPWQIWAEVSNLASARRAIDCGAQGLVVDHPTPEWLPVLEGIHLHTKASLGDWANRLRGTIEGDSVPRDRPGFGAARALAHDSPISEQIATAQRQAPATSALVVPVGPAYFEETAKFRALRRLCPGIRLIARTSRWHATAYDPHVNLLRATTEAMAAIIGGCDALIVGSFTEARGATDELAERLAINTQLLLRDESYFGQVADPAAGSWYIEALTAQLTQGSLITKPATAFVGTNRYPSPQEPTPDLVTPGRAMTALEQCRQKSERAPHRPTVRLVRGTDEKLGRARAAFSRDFFTAGGFTVIDSDPADLTILCDADSNYPTNRAFPVLAAGPDFDRHSDHAALIAAYQTRLGLA